MNAYEISYQDALDGKYQLRVRHGDDLWSGYFDRIGAMVMRKYGDPQLRLGSDHLQNIADLIYSGRIHGIDAIEIVLDNVFGREVIEEHFYAIVTLPEVVAKFDNTNQPPSLRITFRYGKNTSSEPKSARDAKGILEVTAEEFKEMLDEIHEELAKEKSQDDAVDSNTTLRAAIDSGTRHSVNLPDWIKEKYNLKGDNEDTSKWMVDHYILMREFDNIFSK